MRVSDSPKAHGLKLWSWGLNAKPRSRVNRGDSLFLTCRWSGLDLIFLNMAPWGVISHSLLTVYDTWSSSAFTKESQRAPSCGSPVLEWGSPLLPYSCQTNHPLPEFKFEWIQIHFLKAKTLLSGRVTQKMWIFDLINLFLPVVSEPNQHLLLG